MNMTRRQRFILRLAGLSAVNAAVYLAAVSSIRSAKASRPSYMAADGSTDYDGVVRASFANWWRHARGSGGGGGGGGRADWDRVAGSW